MENKENKKKYRILLLLLVVGILLLGGISYAWLKFQVEGEREFNLTPQGLDIKIVENSGDLTLSSSMPVPDKVGMQGTPFEFSIQNNSKVDVQYTLKLVDDDEKRKACDQCNFVSSQDINYELVRKGLDKVDTLTDGREIDTGVLKRGEKNKVDYALKIWLKENASNASNGGVFYGKIEVEAVQILGTSDYAKPVADGSGANVPELGNRLIPVVYNEASQNWEKANITKKGEWFDYAKQKWANAVIVEPNEYDSTYKNAKAGTTIPMDDILQMYVWVPRYSYTIQGDYGKNGSDASNPGEIDVQFVNTDTKEEGTATYSGDSPSGWYTPDAFTLGSRELSGIWVGKFETGYKDADTTSAAEQNKSEPQNVIIKPGVYSWRVISVSNVYSTAKRIAGDIAFGMSETIYDSHAMKNDEWAAVAYLTQSKYGKYGNSAYEGANKEVYINNYFVSESERYKTGCSGGAPGLAQSADCIPYNDLNSDGSGKGQRGPGASTTGNIYGVYDMAGGSWEYVMGNYDHTVGSSGFTGVWDTQYKDYINFYTTSAVKSHALSETAGWYGDSSGMVNSSGPWFGRGGGYVNTTDAGVFYYNIYTGGTSSGISFRVVLTLNKTSRCFIE